MTASGPADTVPLGTVGDWRDGDRVFIRVAAATLARGTSGLVLGWKDRTLRPDPDGEFPKRSAPAVPPRPLTGADAQLGSPPAARPVP